MWVFVQVHVVPFIHTSDLVWNSSTVVQSCSYGCFFSISVCITGKSLCCMSSSPCSLLTSWQPHIYTCVTLHQHFTPSMLFHSQTSSSLATAAKLMLISLSFSTLFFISSKVIFSFTLKMSTSFSISFSVLSVNWVNLTIETCACCQVSVTCVCCVWRACQSASTCWSDSIQLFVSDLQVVFYWAEVKTESRWASWSQCWTALYPPLSRCIYVMHAFIIIWWKRSLYLSELHSPGGRIVVWRPPRSHDPVCTPSHHWCVSCTELMPPAPLCSSACSGFCPLSHRIDGRC